MNLNDGIKTDISGEQMDVLCQNKNVRIERIISNGQCSPEGFWYDQDEDEWICLLQGNALIEYDNGERVVLNEKDYLFIPARKKHRVGATAIGTYTIWLCVFTPP